MNVYDITIVQGDFAKQLRTGDPAPYFFWDESSIDPSYLRVNRRLNGVKTHSKMSEH
jgi:hypothetical protein